VCMFFLSTLSITKSFAQKNALIHDSHAQVRPVGNFSSIKISSGIDLYLTQSDNCQVAVSANTDEVRDKIQTNIEGETLVIKLENSYGWSWNKWSNPKMKAYVSVKTLNELIGSGATNIQLLSKIESAKLTIKLSGASDLKGDVEAGLLMVNLSGASDLNAKVSANSIMLEASGASTAELNGVVDDISVDLSGASDAKLYDLLSKGAIVKASGASTVNMQVSKLLKAQASGASNINYKGTAIVKEMNSSGASSIRHKD